MNGVAQIVCDLGRKADPRKLAKLAAAYENSSVRRLGFLLEQFGMNRQAEALVRFAKKAKSTKLLDSSIRPLPGLLQEHEACEKWMLTLNRKVEIDS